ncbi:hypothetical protein ACE1CD_15470 [Aerosakkonema sp. BLCC-F183]|uniref:hypothetical protein n=1 Tax=Aerosakkonema sp. BLCC-F183 TaxID=3342834 RepID=UPI0035BB6C5F
MSTNSSAKSSIKISIPTKENKQASQLRDALRVIAWQQFKIEYEGDIKGLKLYQEVFEPEWNQHEVHQMNLQQLMEMIKSLGYTVSEVLNIRNKYYADSRNGNRNDRPQNQQRNSGNRQYQEFSEIPDYDDVEPY